MISKPQPSRHRSRPETAWDRAFRALSAILATAAAACSSVGPPGLDEHLATLPEGAKRRVHAIFINSPLDVIVIGNLPGVAGYFRRNGFESSRFCYRSSGKQLAQTVRDLRVQDPEARIALIGWSGASLWIWDALTELESDAQRVDLVVYLDSNWIKRRVAQRGHPESHERALLVYRTINDPVRGVPRSETKRAGTIHHLSVAAHPDTLNAIGEELSLLALKDNHEAVLRRGGQRPPLAVCTIGADGALRQR